eukprot:GILI01014575.1.p2 GENE.GILI01014575.1~~GILI01014575.1.p2  ORF type:complete len:119 (+),score=11.67 GILI01014575.1:2177-2533(+)
MKHLSTGAGSPTLWPNGTVMLLVMARDSTSFADNRQSAMALLTAFVHIVKATRIESASTSAAAVSGWRLNAAISSFSPPLTLFRLALPTVCSQIKFAITSLTRSRPSIFLSTFKVICL